MAELIWTLPALNDLDAIADFIALDKPEDAKKLVRKIFGHVDVLERHPEAGGRVPKLKGGLCRQVVEPPCRVIYRIEGDKVFIVHVLRGETRLIRTRLRRGR